jgi:hypothetical protein
MGIFSRQKNTGSLTVRNYATARVGKTNENLNANHNKRIRETVRKLYLSYIKIFNNQYPKPVICITERLINVWHVFLRR